MKKKILPLVYCKEDKNGRTVWFIKKKDKAKLISSKRAHYLIKHKQVVEVPYYLYKLRLDFVYPLDKIPT